jgi:hypothetical protein
MMQLILGYLKAGGLPVFLVITLAGGALWLHCQQQTLCVLRKQNTQLTSQNTVLETRLLQLKTQAASLASVLDEQKNQHQYLEDKSEQTRRQLRQAVAQIPCARQPVPADVIRLQQDALNARPLSR